MRQESTFRLPKCPIVAHQNEFRLSIQKETYDLPVGDQNT